MLSRRHWLAGAAATAAGAEPVAALRGLSRTNLLEYRGADGKIRVGRSRGEWEQRKREALAGMHEVTGPLPGAEKRCPLQVTVEDETDMGSYVRRAIIYSSEPGSRTPAFLCIPKAALKGRRAPGVLCLHPTDDKNGYRVVVGLGGKANRQYASELAERGFVTISPAYVQLADYQPDIEALGYQSGTMKAIWDNVRALDLLDELPQVRRGRYGAIGHSLGGHNAIYTAVHEERIGAVVSSCGFDSFLDYYGGNLKGWVQPRYMMRMGGYLGRPESVPFDFYELIAALAPRRVYINAPQRDGNFRHDSVARIVAAAGRVYELYGAREKLTSAHPDCDHDFPEQERIAAYESLSGGLP